MPGSNPARASHARQLPLSCMPSSASDVSELNFQTNLITVSSAVSVDNTYLKAHKLIVFCISPPFFFFHKENTLENIRKSTESEPNHLPQVLLTKKQASSDKGRCLIEEISSSEIQVEVKKPAYELKVVKDQNEKPLKIEVKIELPGINSVSLCELSVSEVS